MWGEVRGYLMRMGCPLWASCPLRALLAGGYPLNGFLDAVGSCFRLFRAFDPFDILFFVSIRKTIKVFLGFWIIFQCAR